MTKINVWDLWAKNWDNAYRFFNSKGGIQTKARLKKKWNDDFMAMFYMIEKAMNKSR